VAVVRRRARHHPPRRLRLVAALSLVLCAVPFGSLAVETNSPAAPGSSIADTNTQALLEAYAQVQEQLRLTQIAIEQNRKEIREAAVQNAQAVAVALQTIQARFAAQQARDLEAMQSSNKIILFVVSTFAAIGFLTLLMMSYVQWRMSKGLAEISAALPALLGLGAGSAAGALAGAGQSSFHLPGTLQQWEHSAPERPEGDAPDSQPDVRVTRLAHRKLLSDPAASLRIRHIRPLTTAVIVGLICAASIALLLYMVTYSKLGFGYFHGLLKG
jgi:hypothetical protein